LCAVLAITDNAAEGGDLCFMEPGIRLELRSGDLVVFPSHRLSHFNLHYKGERVSLVFHTDAAGLQWALTRNNWGGSKYIKQGIV